MGRIVREDLPFERCGSPPAPSKLHLLVFFASDHCISGRVPGYTSCPNLVSRVRTKSGSNGGLLDLFQLLLHWIGKVIEFRGFCEQHSSSRLRISVGLVHSRVTIVPPSNDQLMWNKVSEYSDEWKQLIRSSDSIHCL